MGYLNLSECVADLERNGYLRRINVSVDPYLEMAAIQRRALKANSPALLFTNPKGCVFPMLANLFGNKERVNFIFRDSIKIVETIFKAKADPLLFMRNPLKLLKMLPGLTHLLPKKNRISKNDEPLVKAPILACSTKLQNLPKLVSWPEDGGPFITLPLVYSEDPDKDNSSNLGMYRIQLSGNMYAQNEVGLHYQLQRGIGIHHSHSLAKGKGLPVHVYVGGPPCLTMAAVMPLPEGMSELLFAGLLGGRRLTLTQAEGFELPVISQCDFLLQCKLTSQLKPEGQFGDHLGYYSLKHDFPVLQVLGVFHRPNAIWPFTSVGRPPQEDTVFGDFIHQLTAPLVGNVFEGVKEVHAVDAAGVHPLLLAIGSERYTSYEAIRKPREILTQAMHLLGTTQTALAKFLLIAAGEDNPKLTCRNVSAFLRHMLERTDFANDLHFITRTSCDTLDYTGSALHEGSRLIWVAAGSVRRQLMHEINDFPDMPSGFSDPAIVAPGILAINGPKHTLNAGTPDRMLQNELAQRLAQWKSREGFPLVVVVDDSEFCAASFDNFLWTAFTRADAATDSYGVCAKNIAKHWSCEAPFILDCRQKTFHAPPLQEDPKIISRIENMAAKGGPLEGLF